MIFQFNIDNTNLQRLSDALDSPISGFVFVPGNGTLINQKKQFIRHQIKSMLVSICFNSERANAIAAEPNDTAAFNLKDLLG
jgi:hypothetical protein